MTVSAVGPASITMRRMALLRNLEQSLSGLVEGTVGRVFRTEVRPTEIARKLAREMEINKRVSLSRTYAPTDYIVYLSHEDRARYAGVEASIAEELGAYLLEHARRERLVLVRRPLVEFRTDQRLRLGEFGIEARTAPISAEEAPPRAESHEAPVQRERIRAQQPDPIGTPQEPVPAPQSIEPDPEPPYEDPYAHDPFGEDELVHPHELVGQSDAAPPAAQESDWLDPVEDWDAPGTPPVAHPEPPAAAPPAPAAPAPPMSTPWIDPSLRSAQAPPPVPAPQPAAPPLTLIVDGAVHQVHGDHAVIGRSRKSDIVVSDPSVSRQHVELRRDAQGWYAVDLASTNGTTIDGQPATTPQRLRPGARIQVGHAPAVIEVR